MMNNKKKYETPEILVTKFEVNKDIMVGEENTAEYIPLEPKEHESATTVPVSFDWE